MANRRVARVGLAITRVGEGAGAGAPVAGERSREKMRQERKRKTVWKKIKNKCILISSYFQFWHQHI